MARDLRAEVEAALEGAGGIKKADYLTWTSKGDLATQARAFALSANSWPRIVPEPTMEEQCQFMADYLMQCLVEDRESDGYVHTGFDAAHVLADWLKHLSALQATSGVVSTVAAALAEVYMEAPAAVRDRIEHGALEHLLEAPALRPFFEAWSRDPVLAEPFRRALEWGQAHPDGVRLE